MRAIALVALVALVRAVPVLLIVALLAAPLAGASRGERSYALDESRTRRQSFAGARALVIENWRGAVTVTAHDGDAVEMEIAETFAADTPEAMARARREVTLELAQEAGAVRAVVDGPFRCRDGGRREGWHGWNGHDGERTYRVTYRFDVKVPRAIDLEVETVEAGEVRVAGTRGAFAVGNVNGGVELDDVAGAGSARAVNGAVRVRFAQNPVAACRFETVNGDVEVAFRGRLAADFFLDTMNGEAYSDFPYVLQPFDRHAAGDGGMRVYRSSRVYAVRVAGGGPEIRLKTLNGDLLIRNQDR